KSCTGWRFASGTASSSDWLASPTRPSNPSASAFSSAGLSRPSISSARYCSTIGSTSLAAAPEVRMATTRIDATRLNSIGSTLPRSDPQVHASSGGTDLCQRDGGGQVRPDRRWPPFPVRCFYVGSAGQEHVAFGGRDLVKGAAIAPSTHHRPRQRELPHQA